MEGRNGSAPPSFMGTPLWGVPLELLQNKNLRHTFEKAKVIPAQCWRNYPVVGTEKPQLIIITWLGRMTLNQLMVHFYWLGIHGDGMPQMCQKHQCAPFINWGFEIIGMVFIRSLEWSAWGHHFVLVLVDYTTWYAEAVPLHSVSVYSIVNTLFLLTWSLPSCHTPHKLYKLLGIHFHLPVLTICEFE